MRWAGDVARVQEWKGAYRNLVGTTEGNRQTWKPKSKWKIILKLIIKKQDVVGDWIHVIQNMEMCLAPVGTLMNIQIPLYGGNFETR
jgi:hypothetical protein